MECPAPPIAAPGKRGIPPGPQGTAGLPPDLMEVYNSWPARFRTKVKLSAGCWTWTASTTRRGYGRYGTGRGTTASKSMTSAGWKFAHRWSYEATVGKIPDGYVIDHLCRTPACVRPDHLEAVTHTENVRRGAQANASGWCRSGKHEWVPLNILTEPDGTQRCRPCRDARERQYRPPKGNAPADRTHCPQGHPYDEANTYVRPRDGSRGCRACHRATELARYWRRKTDAT